MDDLIDLISKVFLEDDLPAPRFGPGNSGYLAALSFIRNTLSAQVHHRDVKTSVVMLNSAFNRKLLVQGNQSGVRLPHILITQLKPLLSRYSTFEKTPERKMLSCCLLYALRVKPRIPVSDIEKLLELFSDAAYFLRPNEAADDFWCSSRMVMFSTLQALLPEESNERAAENTDESLLESLAASPALAHYFQGTPDISDPMRLVLQFAYVLLQMRCSSRTTQAVSEERLDDCYKVGVFKALYKILSDHVFTQGLAESDQVLCFEICYRLLTMVFEVESRRLVSKRHVLHEATRKLIRRQEDLKCDNYLTLMKCLALIFTHCPDAIVQSDADQAKAFVGWLPESGFMQVSPEFFICYIDLITSLANGVAGSERMFMQMAESARNQFAVSNDGYKYLCWDFILESLVLFCRVLTGTGPKLNVALRAEEMDGLTAYMRLFGKIFTEGSVLETEQRIQVLESEFKSSLESLKLQDLFLLLFCKPVPPSLKAAASEALVGVSRTSESALALLKNLRNVGLFASENDPRRIVSALSFSRRYLQMQLASVEAHVQDYTSTVACIEMVNDLLRTVSQLPDRETSLMEVTVFCKDVLLEAIWDYRSLISNHGQLWDLLSAAFDHFLVCLERIQLEDFISSQDRMSPSQLVLHDVLSQGIIYKSIHSCVSKAYVERSSNRFPTNAANRALTSALKLLLEVFYRESMVQHPPPQGFPLFKVIVLDNKDFVQKSLFNVSGGFPKSLQCAAVDLMRVLYGNSPEHFYALDHDFQNLVMKELHKIIDDSISHS